MTHQEFIKEIQKRAGLDEREEAERTAFVVLQALVDRLTGDEAREMLAQLPEPLKSSVTVAESADRMTANEFVRRIVDELQTSSETAHRLVQAFFASLEKALTPGEFHDVLVQLPSGYLEVITGTSAVGRAP